MNCNIHSVTDGHGRSHGARRARRSHGASISNIMCGLQTDALADSNPQAFPDARYGQCLYTALVSRLFFCAMKSDQSELSIETCIASAKKLA